MVSIIPRNNKLFELGFKLGLNLIIGHSHQESRKSDLYYRQVWPWVRILAVIGRLPDEWTLIRRRRWKGGSAITTLGGSCLKLSGSRVNQSTINFAQVVCNCARDYLSVGGTLFLYAHKCRVTHVLWNWRNFHLIRRLLWRAMRKRGELDCWNDDSEKYVPGGQRTKDRSMVEVAGFIRLQEWFAVGYRVERWGIRTGQTAIR